jgi:hypothetical protein
MTFSINIFWRIYVLFVHDRQLLEGDLRCEARPVEGVLCSSC